ncbi:hypothetical protein C2845_PM05G38010 [Panicum miliaceum]|uniref:Uncharacterized protein n=1 Tax=Panicum miliaceum TaxID=4540 RepID=A0A3L6SZJ1_PANMI|nr:hypothetical protein C2845_PM05G38010 [Panicum miliaceum]
MAAITTPSWPSRPATSVVAFFTPQSPPLPLSAYKGHVEPSYPPLPRSLAPLHRTPQRCRHPSSGSPPIYRLTDLSPLPTHLGASSCDNVPFEKGQLLQFEEEINSLSAKKKTLKWRTTATSNSSRHVFTSQSLVEEAAAEDFV